MGITAGNNTMKSHIILNKRSQTLKSTYCDYIGFPESSLLKNLPANAGEAGDAGLIPRWERAPGGVNGNPLQYSCLGNPTEETHKRLGQDFTTKQQQ